MSLVDHPRYVLANLWRVKSRTKLNGDNVFHLAQNDCTATIVSLFERGVISNDEDGKLKRTRPLRPISKY